MSPKNKKKKNKKVKKLKKNNKKAGKVKKSGSGAVKFGKKKIQGKVKKLKNKKSLPIEPSGEIHKTRIKVIGIGGGGCSIVAEVAPHIKKVDFIAANTDTQAIREVGRKVKVFQFGQSLTQGLGCGMDPKIGRTAAKDAEQRIAGLLKNVDLVILVSCLSGGTGSGSAPEFARIAKELGVMSFGIFATPFKFEGVKRAQIAKASLEKIRPYLNAFSVIPNESIFQIISKDTPITEAFSTINQYLSENIRGLVEMIYSPGIINIDFADLKTVLEGRGKLAYLNSAVSQGQNRAEEVIKELLNSPLSEYGISGVEKILFNITASRELKMTEVELVSRSISDFNRRAKIIFGISQDNDYDDKLRITILAVGCGQESEKRSGESEQDTDDMVNPTGKDPKIFKENNKKKKIFQKIKNNLPESSGNPKTPKSQSKAKSSASKNKTIAPLSSKSESAKTDKAARASGKLKAKKSDKLKKNKKVEVKDGEAEQIHIAPTRKNGLDLKEEVEKSKEELFEEEKKWDIPAFLRRQV